MSDELLDQLGLNDDRPKKSIDAIASDAIEQSIGSVCRRCNRNLAPGAIACSYCDTEVRTARKPDVQPWNGLAAVLSFFIPGLGQLYKGDIGRGIVLFVLTLIGYVLLIIPGVFVHVITILDAGAKRRWF
jgi:hypothetical protein